MKKRVLRYLLHIGVTALIICIGFVITVILQGAAFKYGDHPARKNLNQEGPYVFYLNDSIATVHYIYGDKEKGFKDQVETYSTDDGITASCFFPLDSSQFQFTINHQITIPPTYYEDNEPILAISDIEGGYQTFRDFLIANKVIDKHLNWTFGKGHLVLVGDFVDRGWSVTQVLWFIYKMEQDAKEQGGHVHFIIGNHELKNLQGMYGYTADRYFAAAAIMGKLHHHLYDTNSFIGRWLSSKNVAERINGYLFVHGGLHPDLGNSNITLEQINSIYRKNYYQVYYRQPNEGAERLILSDQKGICWYRGYFNEDLSQADVDKPLEKFGAKAVVVGHTLQKEVTTLYNGRVIAIDIKHPKDYRNIWPSVNSQGLIVKNGQTYRAHADGSTEIL
ncbi:metallophosphoesterase [Marinoscillum pacificum]|uniref:metallophosphoesterase n=1 Tax=Marinoscillum pacificum TaxID=392723 RepID=UPI00215741F8|nr:metallophosphoesterase [Marinoscillum pacificum]